ncbi:unnamed protein product [Arctia plantaginis]|uniref:Uncharacterized protein n=1 Tax=Arctia plantaginis TaxID=874455 RepID=A0A8S0YP41_ARCPL|nr:unnamed protein product [Arctia plantaginis]
MCEWLSYGEWCDVKLLCGGRAFSAHRAVLASVSTFLRRILLSCPNDETPAFIILPEFDLDAMASVLYYIYNGEVIVKKHKLEMFLDIIKAMQIFVDNQYLPQYIESNYQDSNLIGQKEADLCKNNIFTLGVDDSTDQGYINLKRGVINKDLLLQHSESNSDCTNKIMYSQNPSEERRTPLGNLKSPYGDRQRNSYLRDLFIETYPRNGNVNGLTSGVLAISNECYRAPASVLLTNANGKHLNDTLLEPYKKTSEHIGNSPSVFHIHKQQRCTRGEQDYGETSKSFCDSFANVCSVRKINTKYVFDSESRNYSKNDWMNHVSIPENSIFQIGVQDQLLSGLYVPSLDYSVTPLMFNSVKSIRNKTSTSSSILSSDRNEDGLKEMDTTSMPKVTILNHVLDSPWSPRKPINYKPFRRKVEGSLQKMTNQKEIEKTLHNDSNNNVEQSPTLTNIVQGREVMAFTIKEKIKTPTGITVNRNDDFKCSICNQVFTSSELLSVHMRRHSANARYTCGECNKTFSQLRNFKYHMSIHRGTREFAATCTVCGKYFNDRGYLSSHMKIHRNRKEYKCTLCPKSFNQRVAYNMHVRIHTGVKPHVCEQCGKAFSRKMLLKQHQRTHSGERPYACPHCDKRFADRSNMTLHLRLHTGIKPFSCSLCPKSFTKKHHLKSHLNFHTGSKPYSCPRCKLAFTQSSNMRTHLKKCRVPESTPDT